MDKNITFRTQGSGSINMMTNLGHYSLSHQMVGANSDLVTRLDSVEASVSNNPIIVDRLNTLEQRLQEVVVRFACIFVIFGFFLCLIAPN